MKPTEIVGLRVQDARQQHGLSQQQLGNALASHLGTTWTRQTVSIAEKGGRPFTITELLALAAVLDRSVTDLAMPSAATATVELPATSLDREQYTALFVRDFSEREARLSAENHRLRGALNAFVRARRQFEDALAQDILAEAVRMDEADEEGYAEPVPSEHYEQAREELSAVDPGNVESGDRQ